MTVRMNNPAYDGTTGRGDHAGRRTHVIKLLGDAKEPLTVEQVATRVDLPVNAARSYLEALVDAGLAAREAQGRTTPGRPKVVYRGLMPTQAHLRAQGFRMLAEIMAAAVAQMNPNSGEWMYSVGREWGKSMMRQAAGNTTDESGRSEALLERMDALWFSPVEDANSSAVTLHNCPFADSSRRFPQAICQLHAGMVNGAMEELGSTRRLVRLHPNLPGHKCEGELCPTTQRLSRVALEVNPGRRQVPGSRRIE